MTVKNLTCTKINIVNPLSLFINKTKWYIEKSNGSKYLRLVPGDESKEKLSKCEKLWNEIIYLIRSITNSSKNSDEKYMKIKLWTMIYL